MRISDWSSDVCSSDLAAGADKAKAEGVDKSDAEIPAEFHKHPAWQRLIRERDENKGAAEQFGQITGLMDNHGLSPAEAAEGFTVMAMSSEERREVKECVSRCRSWQSPYT